MLSDDLQMTDEPKGPLPEASDTGYFGRRLRPLGKGHFEDLDEAGLLKVAGPQVVLGEPGMGKSELLRELGRRLDVEPITAIRFLLSKDPAKLVTPGKPLLIDALDEAMARREGDAVDAVLAALEEAGSPDFVLSCRSREWQARGASNLRQLYGAEPHLFNLEPFGRAEATAFLAAHYPGADADHVLSHLDAHGVSDLYRNPLTLDLLGKVAIADSKLPDSRGALFERVATLVWQERNKDRQDSGLAQLIEAEALSAAGAISAALLLGGAEAASITGTAELQEGDFRIVDIAQLPAASGARAVFASNLFQSLGTGRVKPVHKVVAEYLGARWLATAADTPRKQRRLLAQLQGSGSVPASLRGLHAWLAYHSPALAERVIAADPYGVLRYGETGALTPHQAEVLSEALEALAEKDPWFRSSDWDRRTAAGLMMPSLKGWIGAAIGSAATNTHLRSLLIEGLQGTQMAGELADTLEGILLADDRFYRERADAAKALLPHRDRGWWRSTIARLVETPSQDAGRLARCLVELIEGDVPDEMLVASVLAELGLLVSPLPRQTRDRVHTVRHFKRLAAVIGTERLGTVLDTIADSVPLIPGHDWMDENDVADFATGLIIRALDEGAIGPAEGARLWRWLGIIEHAQRYHRDAKKELVDRIMRHDELRRAAQLHGVTVERQRETLWAAEFDLGNRLLGLTQHPGDIAWFLERMTGADNKDKALQEDWADLMRLGRRLDGYDPGVREAGERFVRGNKGLAAMLTKIDNPKSPTWERRHVREETKRARKERAATESRRRHYASHAALLRAGQLEYIVKPAHAYLGHYSDLPSDVPGLERVLAWLGEPLAADALAGFEAALHRSDLPSVAEVTQGFADNVTYNYIFPVMAGLLERQRSSRGFEGVPFDLLMIGLLLLHHQGGSFGDDDDSELRASLEGEVVPNPAAREAFARLFIEPMLAAGSQHISGLYMLAHDEAWQATGAALAEDWLVRFPNQPEEIESTLVDCLAFVGKLDALARVAAARRASVYRDADHLLSWLAVDVLVRFEEVAPDLVGIGAAHPEFLWCLRERLQVERPGRLLPLSLAQAEWVVAEFRVDWPHATLRGLGRGDTNDYDATDFLSALINRLADDPSLEASAALARLIDQPEDGYSELLRHMAAEQRQKQAEARFTPLSPGALADLLEDDAPGNADDLKALILEELDVAQKKLIGSDVDELRDFWSDDNIPRDENRCRDRLAAMIGPELMRYGIQRITEADMPASKRADLAFTEGRLQLPMEIKGQWHDEVWDAASGQLHARYLIDWRSEQRGIYCVLWFGDLPSATHRRLKAPPRGVKRPKRAEEMRAAVIERIPPERRAMIDVVVLDLAAGKPKQKSAEGQDCKTHAASRVRRRGLHA